MSDLITRKEMNLPIMRRDAVIDANSINEEARTFDIVWTTGARRITWSWEEFGLIEEELDLAGADLSRLNAGAPYLKDHASWSIDNQLGVHVDGSAIIDLAKKEGRATIRMSKTARVEPYWIDIKDRILRQVSVGYSVDTYVVTREEGRLPLYRATKWTPLENSQVTIGADPGAQVRSQGATPQLFPCVVVHQRAATPTPQPKKQERSMKEVLKKRAMDDATKQKCNDILKAYIADEAQLAEATDKIAALWPEETASGGSGAMSAVAKALGLTERSTGEQCVAAIKSLQDLYDAKAAELEAKESETPSEFEANESKGLHRKLEAVRKGFAKELFDSNPVLYRKEVEKVKPLNAPAPTASGKSAGRLAEVSDEADAIETKLNARAAELRKADPELSEQDAYKVAFRELQEKRKA